MVDPATGTVTGVDATFAGGAFADPALHARLDAWCQGDLVADIGLFWAGTAFEDPVTGVAADPSGGHLWPVIAWDGTPAEELSTPETGPLQQWSVITSQTCDVVGTGPGARHPFVQVSPLIDLTGADQNTVDAIKRGERLDRVWVDNVPGGGAWAADLRVSLPVSKAVLAAQERRPAFSTEQAALDFAERVAAKLRRAALHDDLTDGLRPRLRELVRADPAAGWLDDVEQFRLLVVQGTRLQPDEVALVVVTLVKLDEALRAPLRQWAKQERKRLKKVGITLGRVRFRDLDSMSVEEYRTSVPLHIPELARRVWW